MSIRLADLLVQDVTQKRSRRGGEFVAACRMIVALTALVSALVSHPSQGADSTKKVGHLGVVFTVSPGTVSPAYTIGFWARMRELGWVRGENLLVEELWAEGQVERLPVLIDKVVKQRVDVILTATEVGAVAARKLTQLIPIVVTTMGDPVGAGLVSSLSRPGGNLTGFSVQAEGLPGKCLELLLEIAPRASVVALLWNPDNSFNRRQLPRLQAEAVSIGVKLQLLDVRTEQDLDLAFERARVHSQAILVLADPLTYQHRARIVSQAAKMRLPAVYTRPEFAADGGLIGYGADFYAQYRRAAEYVDMILRGTKPGDLPIEQASRFHLVVNLKSARALGLKIPDTILERADQIIR